MDSTSIHSLIIILHAAAATTAFFAGCLLIFSTKYASNQNLFNIYLWTLIGMTILLAIAIAVSWQAYTNMERLVFPALLGLALFMVFRGWGAGLVLRTRQYDWKPGYTEHIGFTLISLFEGFIIVSGLNAGLPGWLVAFVAILGLLAGRWVISQAKRRIA